MSVDPLLITQAANTMIGAFGDYTSLQGQAQGLDLNASLLDITGESVTQQGEFQARRIERAGSDSIGRTLSAYAKAGVKFEGSPAQIYLQSAKNIRNDVITARLNAAQKRNEIGFKALQQRIAAGQARTRSIQAIGKGILDVGSSFALDAQAKKSSKG